MGLTLPVAREGCSQMPDHRVKEFQPHVRMDVLWSSVSPSTLNVFSFLFRSRPFHPGAALCSSPCQFLSLINPDSCLLVSTPYLTSPTDPLTPKSLQIYHSDHLSCCGTSWNVCLLALNPALSNPQKLCMAASKALVHGSLPVVGRHAVPSHWPSFLWDLHGL